ncbi:MAG TPA: sodium:proton antiporter [Polyangiaceae bacterium]
MRDQLESFLLVLAVGSAVAIGAKRIGVPYNVALVLVGLVLVLLTPPTRMNPDIIMVLFLPILVFEGALFADAESLREAARPILALSVPGVALSLIGTAAVATWALDLPFAAALLLGSILAITDTVSVLLAFRSVRVPHRLKAIMEGESLFNDGTALVLVSLTTTVVASGVFDPTQTARSLIIAIFGGLALGAAFGALGAAVLRHTPDHLTAILASLVLVFSASLVSESVHASPVIAVVVAGVAVGHAARRALEPSRVLALQGFWETAGFGLNVLIFLLVGMQIRADTLFAEAGSIALALVALHAGRAIAVYGCFGILRAVSRELVPMRWQHVMVLGNIKGALSMAAVLALPQGLPHRERFITIVFGVTFVTLLTQALPFRRILKSLGVASVSAHPELDAAKAVLVSARRAQAELDELLASGLISRKDHAERRAAFQREIIRAESELRGPAGEHVRDALADVAILNAQKSALLDAARRGLIAEETAMARVNELDRSLVRLGAHDGESS